MPYLAFLFICLVWGSSFILMERASHAFGPVDIGLYRLLGGALVLGGYWAIKRARARLTLADLGHILVVAVLANAWPFVVLPFTLMQAGEHAYFGMLVALVPLATIVASIPMLGIWPTRRQLLGVLGGMLCLGLALQDGAERGISGGLLLLALTVPISYAIGNAYVKWKLEHVAALPLTTLLLALAGLALLPLQFAPLERFGWAAPAVPSDWLVVLAAVAFLSVLGTGVAILLFVGLIKNQGPLFAGMVTYVVPLQAILWGQYDQEKLTVTQLVAIAGVLGMVGLVQWGAAAPVPQTE